MEVYLVLMEVYLVLNCMSNNLEYSWKICINIKYKRSKGVFDKRLTKGTHIFFSYSGM